MQRGQRSGFDRFQAETAFSAEFDDSMTVLRAAL
jgi:hypothetical protein